MAVSVSGAVALVSGANQGIGRGFVEVLLQRGAARVYATARRPETLAALAALDPQRVIALKLDVASEGDRRAVAAVAKDVTLLINNAGIPGADDATFRRFVSAPSLDDARQVMEIDYWAQAEMCRAFLPALRAAKGAGIVNILSIGALFCLPTHATYCAAKAAAAIMTIGLRSELGAEGIFVAGVFTASVESRMSAANPHPKMSAVEHARQVLDAVEKGIEDIYSGTGADELRDLIRADPKAFERLRNAQFQASQSA